MRKVLLTIFNTLLLILLPVILFMLISSRVEVFGIRSFVVETGSMVPRLPVKSLVFTQAQNEYVPGEIITFHRGEIDVTHRIISIQNGLYETKGDANQGADPERIARSKIIGEVVYDVPYIGYLTTFVKTIPGFLLLIGVPTLLFILFEGRTLKKEWEKEIEKKVLKKLEAKE